ncbi:hypothetical protein KAR91_04045 [Candidatus Pacearchaeota archaeon]|nr:hypothetical protein [Candidatus Pacearchaeota archaeon]
MKAFTLRLKDNLHKWLFEYAHDRRISMQKALRMLIEKEKKEDDKKTESSC